MAGPSKKPKKAESGDQGENNESEVFDGQQVIEATFEGRNPEERDYHGIKQLLHQLFLKAHIDLSQMTDMIVSAKTCSTVLHQSMDDENEDDDDDDDVGVDDVFGITSLMNLTASNDMPCVQQLFTLVAELSQEHADKNTCNLIKRIISEDNKLGFIINERFLNIPAKISVHMFKCLQDDMQRIKKKDPSYDFQYFFMICKTCKPKDKNDAETIYLNDEERIFTSEADVSFEFSVLNESDTGLGGAWEEDDEEMVPHRKVVLFKAEKLPAIIQKIESYLS